MAAAAAASHVAATGASQLAQRASDAEAPLEASMAAPATCSNVAATGAAHRASAAEEAASQLAAARQLRAAPRLDWLTLLRASREHV